MMRDYPLESGQFNDATLRIPEQAYFWSEEWQEAEAEATADIRSGRVTRFSNAKDAIRYIKSRQTRNGKKGV